MKLLCTSLLFVSLLLDATSVFGQSYSPTKRFWDAVLGSTVLRAQDGRVYVEFAKYPAAQSYPIYLDVSALPGSNDLYSHSEMAARGPFQGYDVNGNGHADLIESYGQVQRNLTLDVFTERESTITLPVEQSILGDPRLTRILDVDADGMDDILTWPQGSVVIFWGDQNQPLSRTTTIALTDAASVFTVLYAGALDTAFAVIALGAVENTTDRQELRLYRVAASELDGHPGQLVVSAASREALSQQFEGVVFDAGDVWQYVYAEGQFSLRIHADSIAAIRCDPSMSVIDGRRRFKTNELIGAAITRPSNQGAVNVDNVCLAYRFEHTGGAEQLQKQYMSTDRYTITDPWTMAMQFQGSILHLPGRSATVGYHRTRLLPDVDGDGQPEVITGYRSGAYAPAELVDVFLSSYTITASTPDDASATRLSVLPTETGWLVEGHDPATAGPVRLVDLMGRSIPVLVTSHSNGIAVDLQGPTAGPMWLAIGARSAAVWR